MDLDSAALMKKNFIKDISFALLVFLQNMYFVDHL